MYETVIMVQLRNESAYECTRLAAAQTSRCTAVEQVLRLIHLHIWRFISTWSSWLRWLSIRPAGGPSAADRTRNGVLIVAPHLGGGLSSEGSDHMPRGLRLPAPAPRYAAAIRRAPGLFGGCCCGWLLASLAPPAEVYTAEIDPTQICGAKHCKFRGRRWEASKLESVADDIPPRDTAAAKPLQVGRGAAQGCSVARRCRRGGAGGGAACTPRAPGAAGCPSRPRGANHTPARKLGVRPSLPPDHKMPGLEADAGAVNTRRRVKLYLLNGDGQWDDKGTGHITCQYNQNVCGFAPLVN